jgi:hypothetical protein
MIGRERRVVKDGGQRCSVIAFFLGDNITFSCCGLTNLPTVVEKIGHQDRWRHLYLVPVDCQELAEVRVGAADVD